MTAKQTMQHRVSSVKTTKPGPARRARSDIARSQVAGYQCQVHHERPPQATWKAPTKEGFFGMNIKSIKKNIKSGVTGKTRAWGTPAHQQHESGTSGRQAADHAWSQDRCHVPQRHAHGEPFRPDEIQVGSCGIDAPGQGAGRWARQWPDRRRGSRHRRLARRRRVREDGRMRREGCECVCGRDRMGNRGMRTNRRGICR